MAKLVAPPPRFTTEEWTLSNNTNYSTAEQNRKIAEHIRAEADRLVKETDETTEKAQQETTKRIDQRLTDINHWTSQVDHAKTEVMKELEQLLDYKRRIENSLAGYLDRNRALTRKCLQLRENRKAIDLVHDEVQKELIKELEMIQAIEGLLQRTLEQVEEQIRVCRSADYYLGKELNDKFTAFNIDTKCHQLSNTDAGRAAQRFLGSDKITPNSVTPEDWERFSHDNIQKAERNKNAAQNLRSVVDSVLEQTREDLMKQCAATDAGFRRRIQETERALQKDIEHHEKVLIEIGEVEQTIDKLSQAIAAKQPPLMVAETRLNERTDRPNIELCRDAPQYRLIGEVAQINESIRRLQEQLCEAQEQLKQLIRNQLQLRFVENI
ncbi:tektin-1-like isoform X1 [Convolutriloba macropyga]|uniref:tektin-1-like isoform X1 n=1 Tax=Convolutriloba macropyga TaxID=536237 RepID=UPI003F51B4CF